MGVYVGIDVSKDRLDVHVLPQGEAFFVEGNGKGLAERVERLKPLAPSLVVVEATGGSPAGATGFTDLRLQSGWRRHALRLGTRSIPHGCPV